MKAAAAAGGGWVGGGGGWVGGWAVGLAAYLLKQLCAFRPLLLAGSRLLGGQQRGDNMGRVHSTAAALSTTRHDQC